MNSFFLENTDSCVLNAKMFHTKEVGHVLTGYSYILFFVRSGVFWDEKQYFKTPLEMEKKQSLKGPKRALSALKICLTLFMVHMDPNEQ